MFVQNSKPSQSPDQDDDLDCCCKFGAFNDSGAPVELLRANFEYDFDAFGWTEKESDRIYHTNFKVNPQYQVCARFRFNEVPNESHVKLPKAKSVLESVGAGSLALINPFFICFVSSVATVSRNFC